MNYFSSYSSYVVYLAREKRKYLNLTFLNKRRRRNGIESKVSLLIELFV